MIKRLFALGFIFACTSVAWFVLGGTLFARTYNSDSDLRHRVERIWGTQQQQNSPSASYVIRKQRKETSIVEGKKVVNIVHYNAKHELPLAASDIKANLDLEHRQKGLLWYATYRVNFSGSYRFTNPDQKTRRLKITFPFPSQIANYDDFKFSVHDRQWHKLSQPNKGEVHGWVNAKAGETVVVDVAYRSQGLDRWSYSFGEGIAEVKDFRLLMTTNFDAIDFPEDSISPAHKRKLDRGWELTWEFTNLISGVHVGMLLPQKLQPGPLAGEISFFAPVSLFFFILVLQVLTLIRGIDLHPMHFFFLSAAFFAFHLLLAYLVDHMAIHLAFIVASLVSVALVVSYMRIIVGTRLAFVETALAQVIYLVLFSYAFFFQGFTGLAITVGAIVTLFVMMQMTARVDWGDVFTAKAQPMPLGSKQLGAKS